MPNLLINNYCNQKCSYCFASENMNEKSMQKDMNLKTFLNILKYLKLNKDKNIRILGGEPFLSMNLSNFIKIALKGGFEVIIFSNINIKSDIITNVLNSINGNITVNCNINNKSFYKKTEITRIINNLNILNKFGVKIVLGYNIIDFNMHPDLILELAKKHNIVNLNLKITNTGVGEKQIIDNYSSSLGDYIYNFIYKNYKEYNIDISCGLYEKVFTEEQLYFIEKIAKIKLRFGCEANVGKFDINTDGSIFKCFPLKQFQKNSIYVEDLINNKILINDLLKIISDGFISNGICTANK